MCILLPLLLNMICIVWSPQVFNVTLLHPDVVFTEECDITPQHKAFIYAPPWLLPEEIGSNVWFSLENEHSFPSGLASRPRTILHNAADFCGCFGSICVRSYLFAKLSWEIQNLWDSSCICLTIMLTWWRIGKQRNLSSFLPQTYRFGPLS